MRQDIPLFKSGGTDTSYSNLGLTCIVNADMFGTCAFTLYNTQYAISSQPLSTSLGSLGRVVAKTRVTPTIFEVFSWLGMRRCLEFSSLRHLHLPCEEYSEVSDVHLRIPTRGMSKYTQDMIHLRSVAS